MEQKKFKTIKDALHGIDQEMRARRFGMALEVAYQAARQFPETRAVEIRLAEVLETCKEFEKALALYRHVHEKTQKAGGTSEISLLIGIANCQIRLSHYEQATKLLEELKVLAPEYPPMLTALASCRRHGEKLGEAEELVKLALKHDPDYRLAIHEMAQIHLAKKETEEALRLLEKNIRRKDLYGESIDLWLFTLNEANRNRYAQDTLEELMKIHPDTVEFTFGYAVLANQAGEITLARPAYQKSMELSSNNPRIIYELGVLERTAGNLELSQQLIGQALALKPDNPAALRTYCSDLKLTYGDENFARLNFVAAKFGDFEPIEQIHMHYALAKAYEDVEEMDTAFRHYAIAGEKKRKKETYSDREAAKMSKIIPQVVTKARLAETNQVGCQSEVPVFILGMPRSGTSLMEQILSAHPDIFGAGELKILTGVLENIAVAQNRVNMQDKDPVFPHDQNASWETRGQHYVDRLLKLADKPYKRIVDKMPGNFNFVGLIHAVLPKARIIHSRRHPVETCLSCYRIHFAEGHQWTYNLRELGRFYKRYWDLMKYWRAEFPGVMFEARYEDNVADVEGQAKKIIDHLGLEWNDNCLNFYNTDRPVKTASVTQVRKPIYTTSTNRWRKYEKYLEPLLEELGDIVPEYEAEIAHLATKKVA
jgi:tetratricopeptide (TPR) repeat protein